jgi:hypothetical protein
MDMSEIAKCDMVNCTYNSNRVCHTLGINVGPHAECNTYVTNGSSKSGFKEAKGTIGACLTADCKFNDRLECSAPNINVGGHAIHADCETFQSRS